MIAVIIALFHTAIPAGIQLPPFLVWFKEVSDFLIRDKESGLDNTAGVPPLLLVSKCY